MNMTAKILSTFFGAGYAPIAPGTFTSLLIVLLYRFYLVRLDWPIYLVLLLILFFLGVYVSTRFARELNKEDPQIIVIDEVLGQMIPLFLIKPDWLLLAAAFVLFRLFDIIKPFPVNKAEKFPQGWGIMMDDLVAGLYAGIIINIFLLLK
ncbi:MAG: phosphatidylglycerophosphatase A [Candidatus Aminicenantes bacterium]|nr:phosphatidylglycerophosphatase A [Candidatus Aminicenantes bacterium]